MKSKSEISNLIYTQDFEGLRNISQHHVKNSFCKVRFGMHNEQGIHGACPMEMLHQIYLGTFKCVRDCFFDQIGPTSQLADDINGYCCRYGEMLARQSQRDLPKTKFANGVRRGKLMAKEYPGILLCLASILQCQGARTLLRQKRRKFKKKSVIPDWQVLIDTLLQWDMWLQSDQMKTKHVKFAQDKHRYIMYLIKKVGKRETGMGLRLTKFHGIVHMAQDILNFGVPMEMDTGSNESGHKVTKTAARLTQRMEETFDKQTCDQLKELHVIELASAEIEGKAPWEHWQ